MKCLERRVVAVEGVGVGEDDDGCVYYPMSHRVQRQILTLDMTELFRVCPFVAWGEVGVDEGRRKRATRWEVASSSQKPSTMSGVMAGWEMGVSCRVGVEEKREQDVGYLCWVFFWFLSLVVLRCM